MLVELQLVGIASTPLKLTVLVPCVVPKLTPVMVTDVPGEPEVGLTPVMFGADETTEKVKSLLATPPTVTTTGPVVAPLGTGATIMATGLYNSALVKYPLLLSPPVTSTCPPLNNVAVW